MLPQRKKSRRAPTFAVLPTSLTLGNAVCGLGSIAMAANLYGQDGIDRRMFFAGLLIFLAMAFDLLDGHVARKMKQTSRFGEQLDSLCDVVSFGVAPAFLVLTFSYRFHPRFLWIVAVMYVLCVLVRLARYNASIEEQEDSKEFFRGLPSPAAAGMIASYALSIPSLMQLENTQSPLLQSFGRNLTVIADVSIPFVALAVAFLMVSPIRYPHFNYWLRGQKQFHDMVKLIVVIVAVATVHELAVPFICTYFVVAAPIQAMWTGAVKQHEGRPRRKLRPRRLVDWTGQRRAHPRTHAARGHAARFHKADRLKEATRKKRTGGSDEQRGDTLS
jgi:CDP-diacylglycerol--serine O-phosphatidyltransferase